MNNNSVSSAKIYLIISMIIFGTIGVFKNYITVPSGTLAMFRGLIGAAFLILICFFSRKKPNFKCIKNNLALLITSGILIGFNWILLFEAYNNTSVSTATLCYYMAPIFVIFASPIFLKEKLSLKQVICSLIALLGMVFVSGILNVGFKNIKELIGVGFGLGAAVLYAGVILLNKKLKNVGSYDRTIIQLGSAGIILIPYTLLAEDIFSVNWNFYTIIMIILIGLIHTGFAYTLYFGSIGILKAQTTAIYSYIDPIVAIILSALVLNDNMDAFEIVGGILILGATLINELDFKKVRSK